MKCDDKSCNKEIKGTPVHIQDHDFCCINCWRNWQKQQRRPDWVEPQFED